MSRKFPKHDHAPNCPLFREALEDIGGGACLRKVGHCRWAFEGYRQPWCQRITYFLGHYDMNSHCLMFLLLQTAVLPCLPYCWTSTLELWVKINPPLRYFCHTTRKKLMLPPILELMKKILFFLQKHMKVNLKKYIFICFIINSHYLEYIWITVF